MFGKFIKLFRPRLSQEQLDCYFNRLPDSIQVKWERDDKFIVGWVKEDGNEYMTQGMNAKDFIEMVNDVVYTMHDIPEEYRLAMKSYSPNERAMRALKDNSIKSASIQVEKCVLANA